MSAALIEARPLIRDLGDLGQEAAPVAVDLDELTKLFDQSVEKKEPRVLLEVKRGRATRSAVLRVSY